MEIEECHPLVMEAKNSCAEQGINPVIWGGFGIIGDAIYLSKIGRIPCITFAPGDIDVAHSLDEFVAVNELVSATKVIGSLIARWCG
jgi:acetylornithine deacetylase/succinyl-diaminopimelate desuccinylase-like protein